MHLNILLGIFVGIYIVHVHCISDLENEENFNEAGNKPNVKFACEKNKLEVVCPKGQVIKVMQAIYGRKNDLAKCNPNKNNKFNTKCRSSKSLTVMRERCHLKRGCSVDATNSLFGDPCPKTNKYLEIRYKCVAERVTTKITNIKKTTPRTTITPKKVVTPKIPPKKVTHQPVTTSKPKEPTIILTTEKATPKVSTKTTAELTTEKLTPKVSTFEDTTFREITTVEITTKPPSTTNLDIKSSVTTTEIPKTTQDLPPSTTLKPLTEVLTTTSTESPITTSEMPVTTTGLLVTPSEDDFTTREITTDNPTTATSPIPEATSTHEPTPLVPLTTKEIPMLSTPKPRVTAPETSCGDEDLDCIIDDLGKRPDWFICEKDMGSYPHPASKKLFIFCLNWKPSVKKCGQGRVFSEKLMTCINL